MSVLLKLRLLMQMKLWCQQHADQAITYDTHGWFQQQSSTKPWPLMQRWLQQFATPGPHLLDRLAPLLSLFGLFFGAVLISGLLHWQSQRPVNLWWLLLFSVALPLLSWLLSLWLARSQEPGPLQNGLMQRFNLGVKSASQLGLLRSAAQFLLQNFSLGFALGLVASFCLHLLLTDLAFVWSSTLSWSNSSVLQWSHWIATPWAWLWPEAVPNLALIEHSRFGQSTFVDGANASMARGWWPFVLMCLLVYSLLPRLLSYAWSWISLNRQIKRQFELDPCINEWWNQRLQPVRISTELEQAQAEIPQTVAEGSKAWPKVEQILYYGVWSEAHLQLARQSLPPTLQSLSLSRFTPDSSRQPSLLLCKAWEPPLGALADLCQSWSDTDSGLYLFAVPLPQLSAARQQQLLQSWKLFAPQLGANCQLLEQEHG